MSDVKPALKPNEWAVLNSPLPEWNGGPDAVRGGMWAKRDGARLTITARPEARDTLGNFSTDDAEALHALAALCLYDQPFGFTHGDVAMLRSLVRPSRYDDLPGYGQPILRLADRIEALLPPKERA